MKKLKLPIFVILPLLASSCLVSQKKYDIAESGRMAALYSRDSLTKLLGASREEYTTLVNGYNAINALYEKLKVDTAELGQQIRDYQSKLDANKNETENLNAQLQAKLRELNERETTIVQLKNIINEQNSRAKSLLENVKSALTGFNSDELSVREESGKVYVAMSDKLLFESGSATVNDQGKLALGKLAEVLNKQTDIDVCIEGHTDSVPIKTALFKDNWDLSVIRATSVVHILTETYEVNPLQIQPSGRGEFKPVDSNKTTEGRARNRRTEIIIAPRLDKLYELITAQQPDTTASS